MAVWIVTFANFHEEDSIIDSVWDNEDDAMDRVEKLEVYNRWVFLYKGMVNTPQGIEEIE